MWGWGCAGVTQIPDRIGRSCGSVGFKSRSCEVITLRPTFHCIYIYISDQDTSKHHLAGKKQVDVYNIYIYAHYISLHYIHVHIYIYDIYIHVHTHIESYGHTNLIKHWPVLKQVSCASQCPSLNFPLRGRFHLVHSEPGAKCGPPTGLPNWKPVLPNLLRFYPRDL